jgi:glyoxylase-like metal-dependent hydrolase (beta-lactamase superfamily II)
METDKYISRLVEENVYHISDYRDDSFYLIIGENKAILFDTGMGTGDLKKYIGSLTNKDVEVVISHAHWDHIMQVNQFEKVYMNHKDIEIIKIFKMDIRYDHFLDIKDGDILDIGGRKLEVIEVPGHTPGSIVLLDNKYKLLFSGDAIGAGHTWMQLPGCLLLSSYLESLHKLAKRSNEFEKIYNGHLAQRNGIPVPREYLFDLIKAVEKVISGELMGEPYPYGNFGGLYVNYGMATLVYNPQNIK